MHLSSGKVYVAHTGVDSVEVLDGVSLRPIVTIPGCSEASGILCAQEEGVVFAAARWAGKILVIGTEGDRKATEFSAGSKPNGLGWDPSRRRLLVADIGDNRARFFDHGSAESMGSLELRGRPRWCSYDCKLDAFFVNIRNPPGVSVVSPESMSELSFIPVSVPGPHGLDLAEGTGTAYVACDGKRLVSVDLRKAQESAQVELAGEPDAIWHNPLKDRVYCAIGNPGVIEVIDTQSFGVVQRVTTEEGAHTLAFDRKRQRLYSFWPKTQSVAAYAEC
ncbi:MAG: hypothetical protein HY296_05480 [Thaumarchaeota archaeon]|nr:hypothetical protein [Nitrososphaerota archaeon]